MGGEARCDVGVPMGSIDAGWRPERCLRHNQPAVERRTLLVDSLGDSVLSFQVHHRRVSDWPLCAECLRDRRRSQALALVVGLAAVALAGCLLTSGGTRAPLAELVAGLLLVAVAALAVVVCRRAVLPALSAGVRMSCDGRTLVLRVRASDALALSEVDVVGARRWY